MVRGVLGPALDGPSSRSVEVGGTSVVVELKAYRLGKRRGDRPTFGELRPRNDRIRGFITA